MIEFAALVVALVVATTVTLYRRGLRLLARREGALDAASPRGALPRAGRVAFLTCARASEPLIADKVANLSACVARIPGSRALLFIDGGTAPAVAAPGVDFLEAPTPVGKVEGLNRMLALVGEDRADPSHLVLMSDVNVFLDPDAIPDALAPFRDAAVGAVQLVVENRQEAPQLAGALSGYSRADLETSLLETRLGSMVHLDGSACIVRTDGLGRIPTGMADDQAIAFEVLLAGRRIALHPAIAAYEVGAVDFLSELGRKVRVANNSVCAHRHYQDRLHRLPGRVRAMYVGHKVLRWLLPFQLALLGVLTAYLAIDGLGLGPTLLLAAGGLAAVLALAAVSERMRRILVLVAFIAASGVGVARAIAGRRITRWENARRAPGRVPAGELERAS